MGSLERILELNRELSRDGIGIAEQVAYIQVQLQRDGHGKYKKNDIKGILRTEYENGGRAYYGKATSGEVEQRIVDLYYDQGQSEKDILKQIKKEYGKAESVDLRQISGIVRGKRSILIKDKEETQRIIKEAERDLYDSFCKYYEGEELGRDKAYHKIVQEFRIKNKCNLTLKQLDEIAKRQKKERAIEGARFDLLALHDYYNSLGFQQDQIYENIARDFRKETGCELEQVELGEIVKTRKQGERYENHLEEMKNHFSDFIIESHRKNIAQDKDYLDDETLKDYSMSRTIVQVKEKLGYDLTRRELEEVVKPSSAALEKVDVNLTKADLECGCGLTPEQEKRLKNLYANHRKGIRVFSIEEIAKTLDPINPIDPLYIREAIDYFDRHSEEVPVAEANTSYNLQTMRTRTFKLEPENVFQTREGATVKVIKKSRNQASQPKIRTHVIDLSDHEKTSNPFSSEESSQDDILNAEKYAEPVIRTARKSATFAASILGLVSSAFQFFTR